MGVEVGVEVVMRGHSYDPGSLGTGNTVTTLEGLRGSEGTLCF